MKGMALKAGKKLMFCVRARLYSLRKNSCFVSGHDFTACGKTHVFEGYELQLVRKCLQTGLALATEG